VRNISVARKLLITSITAMTVSTSLAHGAASVVTGTDPNDVPIGSADILSSSKWNTTTTSGVRRVVFRVDFEEPPSEVYALTRVRIDTRGGADFEGVISVDIGGYSTGRECFIYLGGDHLPCVARTASGAYTTESTETWWRVSVRRSLLRPIERMRWLVETDSDGGTPDRAPDAGWYGGSA
jgi:hypothetical protein